MSSKKRCRICGCEFRHTVCRHEHKTNCIVEPSPQMPDVCLWCVENRRFSDVPKPPHLPGRPRSITKETSISTLLYQILLDTGYPLETYKLRDKLRDNLRSKKRHVKASNVYKALERNPLIVKCGSDRWALAEWNGSPPRRPPANDEFAEALANNQITRAAIYLLKLEGHPLHTHEVCERFRQHGWDIHYDKIYTALRKSPYFCKVGAARFALKEKQRCQ